MRNDLDDTRGIAKMDGFIHHSVKKCKRKLFRPLIYGAVHKRFITSAGITSVYAVGQAAGYRQRLFLCQLKDDQYSLSPQFNVYNFLLKLMSDCLYD